MAWVWDAMRVSPLKPYPKVPTQSQSLDGFLWLLPRRWNQKLFASHVCGAERAVAAVVPITHLAKSKKRGMGGGFRQFELRWVCTSSSKISRLWAFIFNALRLCNCEASDTWLLLVKLPLEYCVIPLDSARLLHLRFHICAKVCHRSCWPGESD